MKASQQQVGGDHYRTLEIQPWDAMKAWMTPAEFRGFLRGNAIKYLARCDKKGQLVADLRKARHYLDKLIEEEVAAPLVEALGAPPLAPGGTIEEALNREATRRMRGFHPQAVPADD